MWNWFKKKTVEPEKEILEDAPLEEYITQIEQIEKDLNSQGYIQQYFYTTKRIAIYLKNNFITAEIRECEIKYNNKVNRFELRLPYCKLTFYTKERAMEVQKLWIDFLIKLKKENKK